MHAVADADATKSSPTDKNAVRDSAADLRPFLHEYEDGRFDRLLRSPLVAASEDTGATYGVSTRDVVIDRGTGVSARLFLPNGAAAAGRRLPLVVYFHGGAFVTESAFCRTYHRYATSLASRAGALVASVEYRLAPEHPIPAAYDDAWTALQWVASLSDPWLAAYADPRRMFLAGDSAGGNIAYHTAVRASCDGDGDGDGMEIEGLLLVQPYFWGAERLPSEMVWNGVAIFPPERVDMVWPFVTAGQAGNDDPRIDPPDEEIASLTCRRTLVAVAGNDSLWARGLRLAARMRECGNVTLVESEGEDHGFHLYRPLHATSKKLMESIVQFINETSSPPPTSATLAELHEWSTWKPSGSAQAQTIISVPTRPYKAVLVDWTEMKDCGGPISAAGRGKASKTSYGSYLGQLKPNKAHQNPFSVAVPWRTVMNLL